RDVRLPRLHAHLREEEEQRLLHGAAADDSYEVASQTERGESRASSTYARPHPGIGQLAARPRWRTRPLLRSAHQRPGAALLSIPSRPALAPCAVEAQPERTRSLESNAAAHPQLAAPRSRLPPLSSEATWRHHLRQEPDAGNPLVRIR